MKLKTTKVGPDCPFCDAQGIESDATLLVIRRDNDRTLYRICTEHDAARGHDPQTMVVEAATV